MVALFVDSATLLGVPKSAAAVYGILFASPEPLSFSEISARLNFSNGSISQALKALRENGAIRPANGPTVRTSDRPTARQPTSARASFEPDTEMRRLIQRFIEQRLEAQLSKGKARLAIMESATAAFARPSRQLIEQRLQKLLRWHERTHGLLLVIKTFLKLSKA